MLDERLILLHESIKMYTHHENTDENQHVEHESVFPRVDRCQEGHDDHGHDDTAERSSQVIGKVLFLR